MRKCYALFFVTVLLLSQTPLQQILKLPVLFAHFDEHQQIQADISFIDYLQLHYGGNHPQDDDYQRDQQLPFRANDFELISSQVVVPNPFIPDCVPTEYQERTYPLRSFNELIHLHTADIWQPPKMA